MGFFWALRIRRLSARGAWLTSSVGGIGTITGTVDFTKRKRHSKDGCIAGILRSSLFLREPLGVAKERWCMMSLPAWSLNVANFRIVQSVPYIVIRRLPYTKLTSYICTVSIKPDWLSSSRSPWASVHLLVDLLWTGILRTSQASSPI